MEFVSDIGFLSVELSVYTMKKVGVLFIIFLALAAFVYFYEIVGEIDREEARSLEESLLRTRQAEITAVEILRPQE